MCGAVRCVEPTVIASSALPGSLIVRSSPAATAPLRKSWFQPYPVFPDATTTTTPETGTLWDAEVLVRAATGNA